MDTQRIDALFADWDKPDSPGAAIAIVRDGDVLYERGYGCANLEYGIPITPETVFDIASVSKQFAGLAIAMLAVEGKIALDADIHAYLPELPDFGASVTVRHLVHHMSGIRDWVAGLAIAGWRMDDVITFDHILNMALHQRSLNFAPGAEYCYSNTGYNLLAEIVARVSGQSFRAWTDAHFFQPLSMTNTRFRDDHQELIRNRAVAYGADEQGGFHNIPNNLVAFGSSSLFTTVHDLTKWALNFETKTVGDPAAFEWMHRQGVLNDGTRIGYAFGVIVDEYRGLRRVQHSGGWAGFSTHLVRFPDDRTAIIVLCNQPHVGAGRLAYQIADILLADRLSPEEPKSDAPPSEETSPPTLTAEQLEAFVGDYVSDELETTYHLRVRDGQLVAEHWRHGETQLSPVSDDRFRMERWWMPRLDFLRDDAQNVIGFEVMMERIRHLRFTKKACE
jgi:CubicO group peptidase (beta-lactamase class C family)